MAYYLTKIRNLAIIVNMENLEKTLAKNLVKFRLCAGLTQNELAQKINYSDKSISKWERGEGMPDVAVLVKLSEIYKISINDFFDQREEKEKEIVSFKKLIHKHWFISVLSSFLVWFVATFVFAFLYLFPATQSIAWFSFIYAFPVCGIVLTVLSSLWGNVYTNIFSTSLILWGVVLSICLSLKSITKYIWVLCLSGGIFEILIVIWFVFFNVFKAKKKMF